MLTWETLLAFSLASVILIIVPGPSVLFVIGRSLSLGRRGGLLSVLGNELGGLPLAAAVALGVGAVVARSAALFGIIKFAGAGYLIYLGVQTVRHRHDHLHTSAGHARAASPWRIVGQGFIVGVTNPKTIVFFVAALPQFVDVGAGHVAAQMIVLGIVFTLIAFTCDATWAVIAGTARTWFASSPRRLSQLRAGGGSMMIALGGVLALSSNKA